MSHNQINSLISTSINKKKKHLPNISRKLKLQLTKVKSTQKNMFCMEKLTKTIII